MLRASLLLFVLVTSCAPARAEVEPPPVDVASVRAQLANVIAPEPRGRLDIELARTSSARVTIAREPGVSVSVAALDVPDAPMRVVDARTRAASEAGLDVIHVATEGRFEELRRVAHRLSRIEQRYSVTLGPSLVSLRVVDDHVEALDGDGVARLRTEPAFAVDARGVVRPLVPHLEGETLWFSADAADLVPPIAIDPAWTATSGLVKARSGSGVFPIAGKKLIVVGGANDATTEIYDVATASFTMGPSLSRVRTSVPVQLDDGRVFVPAGAGAAESVPAGEIYDPAKGTWKTTVAAPFAYGRPVATPLTGGRALVVAPAGASIYDAKTDTWAKTGSPIVPRNSHHGVRLADGRALIVAGVDATGGALTSAELFDPATGTFSAAGALGVHRLGFAIEALSDGHVVVAGGDDAESGTVLDSVELFDPATKTWSAGPKMGTERCYLGSAVLPDGRLMIAGGIGAAVLLSSAEIFDPAAKKWIPAGSMTKPRGTLALSALVPGEPGLIAVGGYVGNAVRDVDLFQPLDVGKICTGAGECVGGACVDGVCCEKAACAADETCGGASSPGHCRKKLGATCAKADECGNGFCVDGVCCDRACDGLCEACDVASTKGRCTTLAPGEAPHGAHGKCPGEGACTALCGGVDAKTCTVFPGRCRRVRRRVVHGGRRVVAVLLRRCGGVRSCGDVELRAVCVRRQRVQEGVRDRYRLCERLLVRRALGTMRVRREVRRRAHGRRAGRGEHRLHALPMRRRELPLEVRVDRRLRRRDHVRHRERHVRGAGTAVRRRGRVRVHGAPVDDVADARAPRDRDRRACAPGGRAMKRLVLAVCCSVGCANGGRTSQPSHFVLDAGSQLVVRAPARAPGALHVERAPGVHLDIEAVGTKDVPGHVEPSGAVVYEGAFDGTRVVHLASAGRTEELRYTDRAPSSLDYHVRLGPGLARLRVVDDYVEALDERGVAQLRTEPAFMVDARGVRRAMAPKVEPPASSKGAWGLSFAVEARGLAAPFVIDPAWTVTTALAKARRDNSLTVLPTGKAVTIAGLGVGGGALTSVEVWDPATSSWTSGGALKSGRTSHGAALLSSGKIVVVGGDANGSGAAASSAEIYDPSTGTSALIADPAPAAIGAYPYVFSLGGDLVLAVGQGASAVLDVGKGTWTAAPYVVPRQFVAAAQLPSGKVLVAGGSKLDLSFTGLSSAELFDPATKAWKAVPSMSKARAKGEAQVLPSGKVLVAGGQNESSAEIYDPVANAWSAAPSMSTVHSFCASVVLPDKRILVVGGDLPDGITDATDIYDPVTNAWSFAGRIAAPRDEFGLAVLGSGKVMVAGGSNGSPVAVVEIFQPMATGQACLGPGECTSGFCVDGFCCEKSACAAGETCAGRGAPGRCAKVDGASCANDAECGSAHCVDGVCCDDACSGSCGACNLKGSEGKCVAVPAGDAPHGSRAACPGEGACAARCGGIEIDKCTQFPGTAISCAPASCKDGVESRPRGCDGAGACAPAITKTCDPYVCGKDACKTRCDVDADCTEGNTCDLVARKCVIAAKCDGDHTVTSPDGKAKDCSPYRCDGSRCLDACTDSAACSSGFACDTASGRCVPAATPPEDTGGCALGAPRASTFGGAFLLLALGFLRRRTVRRACRV